MGVRSGWVAACGVLAIMLGGCHSGAAVVDDPDAVDRARAVVAEDPQVDTVVSEAAGFRTSCGGGLDLSPLRRRTCASSVRVVVPQLRDVGHTITRLTAELDRTTDDERWSRCLDALAGVPAAYDEWALRLDAWAAAPDAGLDAAFGAIVRQDEQGSRSWEIARLRCQDALSAG